MAEGSPGAAAGAAAGAPTAGEGAVAQATQTAATEAQSSQESTDSQEQQTQPEKKATEKQPEVNSQEEGEKKPPHKYHDKLTKYYPDRKFESDDDYDSAYDEYVSDHEEYRKRGDESNQKLLDFFDSEPKVKDAIKDSIENGVPFVVALAKHFGPEDFTIDEGDERYADFEANRKERNEKLEKQRAWETDFKKNSEESNKALEKFTQENNVSPEDVKSTLEAFDQMVGEILAGKVTEDSLNRLFKGNKYEAAIQDAADTAELKGKNQAIKIEMKKDAPKGDGLPAPAKGGEVKDNTKPVTRIDQILQTSQSTDVLANARRQRDKK